ncbi:Protein sds23 [Hondaea fermentalgiana]|uniref:Protein sds23 n=1 Tax=Hondaea fermentalgiana TaxID=2315210 RepID=A0A2R5GNF7_9STRA|nr:Protein sds23 [Hondaea fermentalgiana]|eukprot:GBG32155.1 Protein sds23 [Hondaea fermentalgiana]
MDLFSTKKVGDFPFASKAIVEVKKTDTVDAAFRQLVQHKILSAPVYDDEAGKYLGFFDITDALALIYSVDLLISAIPDSMLKKSTALRLATSGSTSPDCTELLVGSIFDSEEEDQDRVDAGAAWHPVTEDAEMKEVMTLLATSTRRVPVIGEDGRITKIISQSHVTHVLNELLKEMEANGEELPEVFSKTPKNSGGFGMRDVLTVESETQLAKDAFRLIIENGVSAVGVLDEEGKLLSSITTKDIRLFGSMEEAALQRLTAEQTKRTDGEKPVSIQDEAAKVKAGGRESLALMDLNCGDFVSMVELTASNKEGITRAPAVVVRIDTPIRKIISKLALTKKHRVFVCDESRTPLGVVSVSDIAKLLISG